MKESGFLVVVLAVLHLSHRRLMTRDPLAISFHFGFIFSFPSTSHYSFVDTQQENVFGC